MAASVPDVAAQTPVDASRIDYVDGLRGVAISLVLLFHAWYATAAYRAVPHGALRVPVAIAATICERGYLGVPLFFVLSGFCLSYPMLRRRSSGREDWFVPSTFFARRCLRILPAYYVALALSVLWNVVVTVFNLHRTWALGPPITLPNLLDHIALVQNLTPDYFNINGVFWSLGLEWQWYWLFPVVLLLFLRAPRLAFAVAFLVGAAAWVGLHAWWPQQIFLYERAPIAALVAFLLGILAAQLMATERDVPVPMLVAAALLALVCAEAPLLRDAVAGAGLYDQCYAVFFTALLLLGTSTGRVRRVLSWRPLVTLGFISYSVYLVHLPVLEYFAFHVQTHPYAMVLPSIAIGIAAGALFFWAVERPCIRRETWLRVAPMLTRLLGWTDVLYGQRRRERRTWAPAPEMAREG